MEKGVGEPKMINLPLGTGAIKTDSAGYVSLIEFYEACTKYSKNQIVIGFESIVWIDGNMAALLMAIVQKLEKDNSLIFLVDENVIRDKFDILIRNGLLRGVEFVPRMDKTEIKLTGFGMSEDEKFIHYIENDLLSNENLSIDGGVKKRLVYAFLELFCNVQKHARTDSPIFACGQYFQASGNLCFTLVDCGVGYLTPIMEFTKNRVDTSAAAIMWALEGRTTKIDTPGGLGLKEIQKFCDDSGSTFVIITGGAYWTNYQLFPIPVKPFCGTIVNIIFDCHRL